ncbi:MAG: DUF559 domain-containing protein [Micropepsaceae bacterium]
MSTRQYARHMRQSMNKAEVLLWIRLRRRQLNGLGFRRQYPIGPYFADFACPVIRLSVEVDGATHWTDEAQSYDRLRRGHLEEAGWKELRVVNQDVYDNIDGVLALIASAAAKLPRLRQR